MSNDDSARTSDPFRAAPRPDQPAGRPAGGATTDTSVVRGTGLAPLPGETVVQSIGRSAREDGVGGSDLGLHLTNWRLIVHGRDRILNVFPSGRRVRSALIADVDSAGVATKRLPTWILVIGVVLVIVSFGLFAGGGDSSSDDSSSSGAVTLVMGGAAIVVWILLKREALVFTVGGAELFSVDGYRRATNGDEAGSFISAFYAVKTAGVPPQQF